MYDAIVVGARCAGAPTAMLLARKGYSVLLIDKAAFPSDTVSTHIVWPRGSDRLRAWGLLDRVAETGCPLLRKVTFDVGPFALEGTQPAYNDTVECYAPRRTVLDAILIDAAREAGVEVRENCALEELVFDGDRVTGVRCRDHGRPAVTENARIVIGADGRNSAVAKGVDAPKYNEKPVLACWYYAYWSMPSDGIEFYSRPERAIGLIPTNDGLVCAVAVAPFREFDKCRADIEGSFTRTIEMAPDVAERLRNRERQTRFSGTGDVPNFFRKPYGRGWALVGDAGYHKDPIGAQGISDAFRDADRLADAIDRGLSGTQPMEEALADYEKSRNDEVTAMYWFNCELAALAEPPEQTKMLFGALHGNQADTDRFVGMLAGTVPVPEFFDPANIERIRAAAAPQ